MSSQTKSGRPSASVEPVENSTDPAPQLPAGTPTGVGRGSMSSSASARRGIWAGR